LGVILPVEIFGITICQLPMVFLPAIVILQEDAYRFWLYLQHHQQTMGFAFVDT
jgi:hypothetical protein